VKVWEPSAPQRAVKINEGTPVYSVAFSHNNKVLAVAGEKGQAALYGGKGASPEAGAQLAGHMPSVPVESSDSITCITFMPNDSCLVGGCLNGVVHLWMLKEEVRHARPTQHSWLWETAQCNVPWQSVDAVALVIALQHSTCASSLLLPPLCSAQHRFAGACSLMLSRRCLCAACCAVTTGQREF
jgi:WD40 repeat protein